MTLVVESRGQGPDQELERVLGRIVRDGTDEHGPEHFARVEIQLVFVPKSMNAVGTQLADLAAYPVARWLLDSGQPNPAFEVLAPKLVEIGMLP